jgi:transcription antitermination protein NusB
MQGLCCLDVQGAHVADLVDGFIDDSREPPDTIQTAHQMLRESLDDKDECDLLLARHARHWDLARLALVDRNILRLAVHELRTNPRDFRIAIAEAVRLAQEFSTAESPRFVNGVLDAIAKELLKGISRDAGDTRDEEEDDEGGLEERKNGEEGQGPED